MARTPSDMPPRGKSSARPASTRNPGTTPRNGTMPPPKAKRAPRKPEPLLEVKTGPERIAKVIARSGAASRRDAERMIEDGRVSVNGKQITSPALDVSTTDRILLDGKPLAAPEPARLWLYNKPLGLVTSSRDELGRPTIFDYLPEDLPRVMTVGRLDLNSEGLLLLTNDGELKRKLELPATGWLRRYRVRINGRPEDADFEPLREGIMIDGEVFQPMIVTLDRQQGANAWLTVGIREGRNREVRRSMEAIGYTVNRLIRVSYGPFQIGELKTGEVMEVRPRVLREQLGMSEPAAEIDEAPAPRGPRGPAQRGAAPARGGRPQDGGTNVRMGGASGRTVKPNLGAAKDDEAARGGYRALQLPKRIAEQTVAARTAEPVRPAPAPKGKPGFARGGARAQSDTPVVRGGYRRADEAEDGPSRASTLSRTFSRGEDKPAGRSVGAKPGFSRGAAADGAARPARGGDRPAGGAPRGEGRFGDDKPAGRSFGTKTGFSRGAATDGAARPARGGDKPAGGASRGEGRFNDGKPAGKPSGKGQGSRADGAKPSFGRDGARPDQAGRGPRASAGRKPEGRGTDTPRGPRR